VVCNLSLVVKNEGVLKVTGSHVHFTSSSVLKTVLDKDVETTVHKQEVICRAAINSSNSVDLGCMSRSFIDCKLFSILTSAFIMTTAIIHETAARLASHGFFFLTNILELHNPCLLFIPLTESGQI